MNEHRIEWWVKQSRNGRNVTPENIELVCSHNYSDDEWQKWSEEGRLLYCIQYMRFNWRLCKNLSKQTNIEIWLWYILWLLPASSQLTLQTHKLYETVTSCRRNSTHDHLKVKDHFLGNCTLYLQVCVCTVQRWWFALLQVCFLCCNYCSGVLDVTRVNKGACEQSVSLTLSVFLFYLSSFCTVTHHTL